MFVICSTPVGILTIMLIWCIIVGTDKKYCQSAKGSDNMAEYITVKISDQPFDEQLQQQSQQQAQLAKKEEFNDEGGIAFSIRRMSLYGDVIE